MEDTDRNVPNNEEEITEDVINEEELHTDRGIEGEEIYDKEDVYSDDEIIEEEAIYDDEEVYTDEQVVETPDKKRSKSKQSKKNGKKSSSKKPRKEKVKKRQSKNNVIVALGIILLIGTIVYGSWAFYFSFEEINPFDLIQIEEKGGDDQGYLEIIRDNVGLDEKETLVLDVVEFKIDDNEALSQGDKRDIHIMLDDQSKNRLKDEKIRLKPTTLTYKVRALGDVELIDVFENMDVQYEVKGPKVRIDTIEPVVSDLELKELLSFTYPEGILKMGEKFEIELEETDRLETYLLDHGIKIDKYKESFVVEDLEYLPETIDDIPNVDDLKKNALETIETYYLEKDEIESKFRISDVCFTNDAENNENAKDQTYAHTYENGSLMFVVEYDVEDESYADAIGYTNIVMKNGEVDGEKIRLMHPLHEETTRNDILGELKANKFNCD